MKTIIFFFCLFIFPINIFSQTTRYWINGGSGNFTDGSYWSLTSGGSQIGGTISWGTSDIARFDANSGSPVVIFTASDQIGKLQVSGSITVTLVPNSTASRTLGVNTVSSDALSIAAGSILIIKGLNASTDRNMTVELDNTVGVIANISGTVKVSEDDTGYGELRKEGSNPTIIFNGGSTYEHFTKETGSDIPVATWNPTSTCLITGIVSSMPGNLDQSFGNFTWNCVNQTDVFNLPEFTSIQGNFTINNTGSGGLELSITEDVTLDISGNYVQTGGNFYPSASSADDIINVGGNFTFSGGIISCPGSGTCSFRFNTSGTHAYSKTGGSYYQVINFEVVNGATLDMGESVIDNGSSGYFTLNSGAGIKTTHSQGIYASGNNGCIQLTGTRTFNSSANFTFYRNGSQSTGTALPSPLGATLTIGSTANATALTLTNSSITINGTLVLVSNNSSNSSITTGSVVYGSTGTLEYQGNSPQTCTNKEFPSSSGPFNLKVNNSWGVSLHESRTLNGTLFLALGQFSIGTFTLTLNGAINKSSGSLNGGTSSSIIFGGTGASTNLPAVILNNLTLNRPNGIGLSGDVTVHGTFTLTSGPLSLNGFILSYGTTGMLKYNGSSLQTSSNAEFPATSGPFHLYSDNSAGVNLHASRTLEGDLTLKSGNFSIGNNTMTLNGAIVQNGGSMTGGASSNIIFGGTSNITSLPLITLNNLTISRPNGISMGGAITVGGALSLTNGIFSIGPYTLTINGIISINGGILEGGTTSNLVFSGSGGNTVVPLIILQNLTIDRSATISMDDDATIYGTLGLNAGYLSIGDNTLNIFGQVTRTSGSLTGGSNSDIFYGGAGAWTILPAVTLHDLIIERGNGIHLDGDVTLENVLELDAGDLSIMAHTLFMNGEIDYSGGNIVGGATSNIVIGGTGSALALNNIFLGQLTLNRASGLDLNDNITVSGTFTLMNGSIRRNDYLMYAPNAALKYQGFESQTTSDEEWPDSDGPRNLIFLNPFGVYLHDDRTVDGMLQLMNGSFYIGENTLTINGFISSIFGILTGGPSSNLVIGGEMGIIQVPSINLKNLILNRSSGAVMLGTISVGDTLNLVSGQLMVSNQTLILNGGPIAGNPDNLSTNSLSGLIFGGDSAGVFVPTSVIDLNTLNVYNSSGVELSGNININTMVEVTGFLKCSDKEFHGPGGLMLMPGAKIGSGHADGISGNIQLNV